MLTSSSRVVEPRRGAEIPAIWTMLRLNQYVCEGDEA